MIGSTARRRGAVASQLFLAGMLSASMAAADEPADSSPPQGAHAFSFASIDGGTLELSDFAGRPLLIANTASRCGFTGQYADLQAVWDSYRDRGLVVIAVPSDDFRQELASDAEVASFCETTFGVDFPMTTISSVRGAGAHPLFQWIAAAGGTQPSWNFHEYLIGPDGTLVAQFDTPTRATDPTVTAAIDTVLPD